MKKILCASAFALFLLFSCTKYRSDIRALTPPAPYYSAVQSYMAECGYVEQNVDSLGLVVEDYLPRGYIAYSAYKDTTDGRLLVPVCYSIRNPELIFAARSVCEHIYSETYDKDGHKFVSCYGNGNTCHLEISVSPDEVVSVLIVTCS